MLNLIILYALQLLILILSTASWKYVSHSCLEIIYLWKPSQCSVVTCEYIRCILNKSWPLISPKKEILLNVIQKSNMLNYFLRNFRTDTCCSGKKTTFFKVTQNIADRLFPVYLLPIKDYELLTNAFLIHSSVTSTTKIPICHFAIFAPVWIKRRMWTLAWPMKLLCVLYFIIKTVPPIDSEQLWWQKYIHDRLNCSTQMHCT